MANTYTYIQNDGDSDLQKQQDALAKEAQALNASSQKLGAQKVAEAREKIAEAQRKIHDALEMKNDREETAAAAKEAAAKEASDTAADTHALIIQDSRPRHKSSSSDSGDTVFAAIPIVAIVFTFGYLSIKTIVNAFVGRGASRQALRLSAEEQAVVEKLQRTIVKLENRVESLETILVETRRSKESYGTKF